MTERSNKFCRFCMCEDLCEGTNKVVSVFDCGMAQMYEKIKNCLQIQLTPEDKIPPNICINCMDCVEKIHNFIEKCQKSQKILEDFYNKSICTTQTSENCKPENSKNALSSEHMYSSSKDYNVIYKNQKFTTNIEYYSESTIQNRSSSCDIDINTNIPKIEDDDSIDGSDYDSSFLNAARITNMMRKPPDQPVDIQDTLYGPGGKKIKLYDMDENMKKIIGDNVYVCNICAKEFTSFFDYHDHQELHNGQFVFSCSKCDEVFSERKKLIEHDINHKVNCNICKAEVLPKSLPAHLRKHTDKHKCNKCGSRHTSKAALDRHVKARHNGEKGFVCYICGKQHSCQSSMNRHIAYHSTARPYQCKYCNFTAKSQSILKVHTSRKHLGHQCVCEICAKMFKSELSLKTHMKRMHNPRKHVCNLCGKAFTEKYNLTNHIIKKHSKQRIYDCKICGREFFTVKKLKEHMHTHRQGCVNCPTCGKEFYYKKYLEKHMAKCSPDVQDAQRACSKSCSLRSSKSLPNTTWLNEK